MNRFARDRAQCLNTGYVIGRIKVSSTRFVERLETGLVTELKPGPVGCQFRPAPRRRWIDSATLLFPDLRITALLSAILLFSVEAESPKVPTATPAHNLILKPRWSKKSRNGKLAMHAPKQKQNVLLVSRG